jgi:hypothetical protein
MVTWHVTRLRCCPVIVWTFNSRTDCAVLWTEGPCRTPQAQYCHASAQQH